MDLHETLAMLRSHALRRDHLEKTKAISRTNMSSTDQAIVENDHDQRMVQLWKCYRFLVAYLKMRQRKCNAGSLMNVAALCRTAIIALSLRHQNPCPTRCHLLPQRHQPPKIVNSKLPNQYATANNTVTDSGFSAADIDEFLANAMHIDDDSDQEDQFDSFVGKMVTCRIRVSSEQARQCMNMIMLKPHCHLTIIDDSE